MKSDAAVMMNTYGMESAELAIASIMKYFPKNVPVHIVTSLEATKPARPSRQHGDSWTVERWPTLRALVDKYCDDRVVLEQYPNKYSGPRIVEQFARLHDEYEYVWKTDDDVFYTSPDTWNNIVTAYNKWPNAVVATGFSPMQRSGPQLLKERLGIKFPEQIAKYNLKLPRIVASDRQLTSDIWNVTFPPGPLASALQKTEPRYIDWPGYWSCCHYYTKRTTIIEAFERHKWQKDEPGLNLMRDEDGRPIITDMHTLVYHYSWFRTRGLSNRRILPKLKEHDFWKP